MAGRSQRDAARAVVTGYHAACVRDLFVPVADALRRFDAGEIDAFEVDAAMFQYSWAVKELWKYCNGVDVFWVAEHIEAGRAPG